MEIIYGLLKSIMNIIMTFFSINFFQGLVASICAAIIIFYVILYMMKYSVKITIKKGRQLSTNIETTEINVKNYSLFAIRVIPSILLYFDNHGENKAIRCQDAEIIVPRLGQGEFSLPSSVSLPDNKVKSIIINYSTIDMLNIFMAKNILKEYEKASKAKQP